MENATILLVDDEQDILDLLTYNLKKEGYDILTARNGKECVELTKEHRPDLVLLDVMMPEMDGMEACALIREDESLSGISIVFLSARGEDYSQVAGLEMGADDYITKPIRPRVLLSRVKAILRRSKGSPVAESGRSVSGLQIDRERYVVMNDGKEMNLPKKEFELLSLLMSKPEHVFTREAILDTIWGQGVIVGDRTIDVHIRKLREKIGDKRIKTIKGVGYKFRLETSE